jgi:hypothetical protein
MRIELYGMVFETPGVTFYLWSPWRATFLEHRLFEAMRQLPSTEVEKEGDELRVHLVDGKAWRQTLQIVARVLKGWQEEAESGSETRTWFWLIDGDTDCNGYDHTGERACLWGGIRLVLDRSNPGDEEKKIEEVDLDNFGLRIWNEQEGKT